MRTAVSLLLLALLNSTSAATDSEASRLFAKLKELEGEWRITEPARDTKISFELIANGSALVERWTMSPTRKSMTIFTMDGDELFVTHYCPQGNTPRLKYDHVGSNGVYYFSFVDGQNLQDKDGSHQHACWIELVSPDKFVRGESYIKNGSTFTKTEELNDPQIFVRAPSQN